MKKKWKRRIEGINEAQDRQARALIEFEHALRDEYQTRAHGLRELSNRLGVIPGLLDRIEQLESDKLEAEIQEAEAPVLNEQAGETGTDRLLRDAAQRHGGLFEAAHEELVQDLADFVRPMPTIEELLHDAVLLAERRALVEAQRRVRGLLENKMAVMNQGGVVSFNIDEICRAVRGKGSGD